MTRLKGKTALITGGSRGIGRAVAFRFAQEGARVIVNYNRAGPAVDETLAALRAAAPQLDHAAVEADVGSEASITNMFARVLSGGGRLDILVNNAGIQAETPSEAFDDAALLRILNVNLIGAARCARAALAHFVSRPGGGNIINTSSVHEIIPKPGFLAYSMSKGGMGNLTKTLALEFAARGIRVNAVAPGAITTDMNLAWTGDAAAKASVESHIPMGYAASAEEIAPVFAFLASDEARYITGQTIYACGGLTLYGEFAKNWSS